MKVFVKKSHLKRHLFKDTELDLDFGWGNGYVLIPKEHPAYEKHYDELNNTIEIHGGLTFSQLVDEELRKYWKLKKEDEGCWLVGFDTAHYRDSLKNWPKKKVLLEAYNLLHQLHNYK